MKPDLIASLAAALLLSAGGWAAKALTASGALAATAVGSAILLAAGWPGAAVLGAFFILGSAIGRILYPWHPVGDAKGERRDAWQVLANGGCAAVGAGLATGQPGLALWIVTGSLAAAGADTWATASGGMSRTLPRLLLMGRAVPAGTNGGMTLLGSAGAVLGACLVSGAGGVASGNLRLVLWGTAIGTGGMVLDSILGAALQGRFRCPSCGVDSEQRMHRCGTRTEHTGGASWLTNDGVNAVTTAAGALAGLVAWRCASPA
jgi:uncharacterized protein (TIGR00297 family)